MPEQVVQAARGFRLRWVLLTMLGLAVGLAAGLLLGAPVEAVVGMILVTPVLTAIVGAALGTSQWLALRRKLAHSRWWIAASAAGLGLGLTVGVVLVEVTGQLVTGSRVNVTMLGTLERAGCLAVIGLVSGFCLGITQGWVLRRTAGGSRTWLWTSTLGLGSALFLASLTADVIFGGLVSPAGFVAFALAGGLLTGLFTAPPLARIVA